VKRIRYLCSSKNKLSFSLSFSLLHSFFVKEKEKLNNHNNKNNYNMPLAKDVTMELEPPKTPVTPTVLISSSLDPLSEERSETIHVQVGPRPFAMSQNILPQKRGGGNSMLTPERLRLSRPASSTQFQFQKRKDATTLPVVCQI
jgi:hypothetical protein